MGDDNSNNYDYNASVPAAYLFSVLFGLVLLAHTLQIYKYKTVFMIVLWIGVGMEFIGYITRIISIKDPEPLWPILVSQIGLVVAPAFMAAQAYMIVGRMMAYIGSEYSFISHRKITKVFVAADVFAILTQSIGGSILGSARGDVSQMKLAKNILLIGLALQVITFGIFMFVAIVYDIRSSRSGALAPFIQEMARLRRLWIAFYVVSVLITVRSIYRTIEFASISFTADSDDPQGYIITHEWVFYVFDSVLILLSCTLFSVFHPGMYLPRKKGLRVDGTVEEIPGRRRFICCGPRKERKPRLGEGDTMSHIALQQRV